MPKAAREIEVKVFHHTFVWPVRLHISDKAPMERFVRALDEAGWSEPQRDSVAVSEDYDYAEIVYFHPFVRDFLFGDGKEKSIGRAIRRFVRKDITSAIVELTPEHDPEQGRTVPCVLPLRVVRCEVLLIRPHIAILIVEVCADIESKTAATGEVLPPSGHPSPAGTWTLSRVLRLQSQLRHVYPPFFSGQVHGDCPVRVEWGGVSQEERFSSRSPSEQFSQFSHRGGEPPMYAHWRCFWGPQIHPLQTAANRDSDGLFIQQLLDNRIPAMSFIAVDDPDAIARDDRDRLPAFDPPGLDYDPEFRDAVRSQFEYLRFRHWGTTYYCNGTSFALLTKTGGFCPVLLNHFRRHYTHLAVIAQYQQAALLYFSDELADIAKDLAGRDEERRERAWRTQIRRVQHRFLKFRTRSYFTEVSNQIQGKELFAMWMSGLGTKELFERVSQTSSEIYQALESYETKELSEQQTELSEIAFWGLGISILLSLISVVLAWVSLFPDTVKSSPQMKGTPVWGPWFWLLIAFVIGGGAIFMLYLTALKMLPRFVQRHPRKTST